MLTEAVVLKVNYRHAINRGNMRKKRAMDRKEGHAYKKQRREEHDNELRKQAFKN